MMMDSDKDKTLVFVSLGVVLFSIITIITFILQANPIIFYACAIICAGLFFYLALNLSKEDQTSQMKKSKPK